MFDLTGFLQQISRPAIMGIVNASGESFSERGRSSADSALARALAHLDCGADILDIGGESTRPGAKETAKDLELNRVMPVIRNLRKVHPEVVLSVDTRHGEVALAALQQGVQIINDVSMLRHSPEIADMVAKYGAALILSHSRGIPENMQSAEYCNYPDGVAQTVARELAYARDKALRSGVKAENIILDPGFGFAKDSEQCWELLANLEKVAPLSNLMIGVSRKSCLGAVTGESDPAKRVGETLAVELTVAAKGIGIIRTHGVRELHSGMMVLQKIRSGEIEK